MVTHVGYAAREKVRAENAVHSLVEKIAGTAAFGYGRVPKHES